MKEEGGEQNKRKLAALVVCIWRIVSACRKAAQSDRMQVPTLSPVMLNLMQDR